MLDLIADEDVGGVHVEVDHPLAVEVLQRPRHLMGQTDI
jgi:hypothetical protein